MLQDTIIFDVHKCKKQCNIIKQSFIYHQYCCLKTLFQDPAQSLISVKELWTLQRKKTHGSEPCASTHNYGKYDKNKFVNNYQGKPCHQE